MRIQHMCARARVFAWVCVLAPFGLESASLAACLQFKQLGWQRGQTGCYKTSPYEVERKGLSAVRTTSMSCTRALYVRVHAVTSSTFTQVAVEKVFKSPVLQVYQQHPYKCASATITLAFSVSLTLSLTHLRVCAAKALDLIRANNVI